PGGPAVVDPRDRCGGAPPPPVSRIFTQFQQTLQEGKVSATAGLLHARVILLGAATLLFLGYLRGIAIARRLRGIVLALSVVALLVCGVATVADVSSFAIPAGSKAVLVTHALPLPLSHLVAAGVLMLIGMFLSIGSSPSDLRHPLKRLRKTFDN